jgi:ferredoxin
MPRITLVKNGQSYEVPAGTSFLEFCQESGAPHTFGCTVGSCGTCVSVIEEGAEHVNPRGDEERETVEMCTDVAHARLGCQLVIQGDVKIRQL